MIRRQRARRRTPMRAPLRMAFSLIEMQIALVISSMVLTAMLVSLDTMFKGYEVNADSASSHVVTRIATNRIMTLIRTGTDFGPFPSDVLDGDLNPMTSDYFEFVSTRDDAGDPVTITRIEYRYAGEGAQYLSWGIGQEQPTLGFTPTGPGDLWLVQVDVVSQVEKEFLMLRDVRNARFSLSYDVGPRLVRATIDVTVEPAVPDDVKLESRLEAQTIRIVASAMPRRIVR